MWHDRPGGSWIRVIYRMLLPSLALVLLWSGWTAAAGSGTRPPSFPVARVQWSEPVWITVVPDGHRISAWDIRHLPWWRWGNTSTDTYLFSFAYPGNVLMVLQFRTVPGDRREALIYVNHLGLHRVTYAFDGHEVRILSEGGHAYVTLMTRHGSWLIDGHPNYQLTEWIDGFSVLGLAKTQSTGHPNVRVEVGGVPGLPLWEVQQLLADPHPGWGYIRFEAYDRLPHAPPFRVERSVMPSFPYLGVGRTAPYWVDENPSPIFYSTHYAELFLYPFVGSENGGVYRINSITAPPHVDFEAPFVSYNFLPDSRYAQLVVRAEDSLPESDPALPGIIRPRRTTMRYSWKMANVTQWVYSLQLAGDMPLHQRVVIGPVSMWSIGPRDLPSWVARQDWPQVSFVQAMNGYPGSEGIYEYTTQIPTDWPWIDGLSNRPPSYWSHPYLPVHTGTIQRRNLFPGQGLAWGFRGDYAATYGQPPVLYVSPVDGLLHLVDAEGGIWDIGHRDYLRMVTIGGGSYFNGWRLEQAPARGRLTRAEDGRVLQQLYAFSPYLVYGGPQGLVVRKTHTYALDRFRIRPPVSARTWAQFVRWVTPYEHGYSPTQLFTWLRRFPGPTTVVPGGQLLSVDRWVGGFRFVAVLPRHAAVADHIPGLGLASQRGVVVVTYQARSGRWTVQPGTPARLTLRVSPHLLSGVAGQVATLRVFLNNVGSVPWRGVISVLVDGRRTTQSATTVVGHARIMTVLQWIPLHAGVFRLAVKASGLATVAVRRLRIEPARPGALQLLWLSWGNATTALVSITMALLLLTGILGVWRRFAEGVAIPEGEDRSELVRVVPPYGGVEQ